MVSIGFIMWNSFLDNSQFTMRPFLSQLAGRDERRSSTNRRALQVGPSGV